MYFQVCWHRLRNGRTSFGGCCVANMLLTGLGAVLLGAMLPAYAAGKYPNRPIELVVAQPPGGTIDSVARLTANKMQQILGQPVLVINKPGANGNIGTRAVATAEPDGYTLALGTSTFHVINPYLYEKIGYDGIKDFRPIAKLASAPNVISVNSKVPAKNLNELVALAKSQPGKLTYGSTGSGQTGQLAVEMLKMAAGIDILHVPYKGIAAATQDALAGRIDVVTFPAAALLPHFKTGALRPLVVTSSARTEALPNVPSAAEEGFPSLESVPWYGVLAPAKINPAIAQTLEDTLAKVAEDPEVRDRLKLLGLDITFQRSDEFAKALPMEARRWQRVIKASGTKID